MNESTAQFAQYAETRLVRNPELRFTVLFSTAARRAHSLAALVLASELFETSFGLSDQRVAESKLNWWAEELAESQAGRAQHPLSRALAVGNADFLGGSAAVAGLASELAGATPADFTAQVESARRWGLGLARLYAAPSDGQAMLTACCNVFVGMGLLRKLQLGVRPGRYGPAVLPMNTLAKHQLSTGSLAEKRAVVAISEQAERLLSLLGEDLPLVDFPELAALAGNLRLTARAILRGASLESPKVNPFTRLFVGWRAAVSARSRA